MKDQFQVRTCHFPDRGGDHPCVLISHPDLAAGSTRVNILFCTRQRQSRAPRPSEVVLERADGLDWQTFCDCSMMFVADSAKLFNRRGQAILERRHAIRDTLKETIRLSARD